MREILFRGKRVDNGEWVCGDLVRHYENQRVFILTEQLAYTTTEYGISRIVSERYLEVIPETVGQSTGLLDKNGKKIFEGDVVVDRWANEYTPVFQNGIYMAYNPKHLTQNCPSTQFNVIWKDGCEIIGNIHDEEEEND